MMHVEDALVDRKVSLVSVFFSSSFLNVMHNRFSVRESDD